MVIYMEAFPVKALVHWFTKLHLTSPAVNFSVFTRPISTSTPTNSLFSPEN